MNQTTRTNLYNLLSGDIKVTDSLIDVGCGCYFFDLIDFENTEFKTIQGLDRDLYQTFLQYRKQKKLKHTYELHQQFLKRFRLSKMDFRDYNFKEKEFSLIICEHVLHFYRDEEKYIYLDLFYNSLQIDGLLFIKLNHCKNEDNTDPSEMLELETNVFQNKKHPEDVRYLIDSETFLNTVRNKYFIIENYTIIDDEALTFVIRKR